MRKKYLSALLFGALLFASAGTFTSCKDYDDDIENLQGQIDKVVSDLASLKSTIDNLNVGVTSVTFDEKTGELKVTTDGQSPVTYTIKTTVDVEEIKITIDGQDLKVNGKVVGKVGDTVKVENGELTINGQPTGIKVGKYAVLDSQTDNKYTITLPDKDGNLQTIELLKSVATNIALTASPTMFSLTGSTPYYSAGYSLFTEINPIISSVANVGKEAQTLNGIAWGVASSDIDWKGPKGAVKAGQLLIGQQNDVTVRVTPQNVELDAQSLKLVDVDGKVAPVVVKAYPSGKDWGNTGSRSVSGNGYWYLEVAMDNTITANNIGTAFAEISRPDATGNYDVWSNKRYALQVNGNILTDYTFVIDTDETQCAMTGKDELKYVADNIQLDGWSNPSSLFGGVSLNKSHTLSIEQASVYDYQFEIVEADQNDAEAWGITLENNVLKGTDAAAGKEIHLNVKLLGVNGQVKDLELKNSSANKITVTFGQITTPAITLPVSTYKVTPVEYYNSTYTGTFATMVLDMGDLFSGLTAQEAISVKDGETKLTTADETFAFLRKTIVASKNTVNSDITFFKADGQTKVEFDDAQANIRNIKYAKVNYNETSAGNLWNKKATLGEHILQMTLKDVAGNEIRKANIPVNVTVPSFFELFTKSGAWTDTTAKTVVNKVGGIANLTQLYNDKTGVSGALFDTEKSTFIADGESAATVGTNNDLTLNANAVNDSHQLKDVTAELVYKIVPECPNFWVTSGKFTMDLVTKLDAAKFVYYVDNAETEITVQPESKNTIAAWDGAKNGLAFVKAGQNHAFKTGVVVNGFTLEDLTSADIINLKFDDKAGDKAKASFKDGALVVEGLAKGNYTTELTVTYKAASKVIGNFVWETFKIKLNVQSVE